VSSTPPRARLSHEEPEAGNLHIRICEGWGGATPSSTRRLGAAAWPRVARAQQPAMPLIGYLSPQDDTSKYETVPFLRGLKETGYVEGQNVGPKWPTGFASCQPAPTRRARSGVL
jgi:hypothetical protein